MGVVFGTLSAQNLEYGRKPSCCSISVFQGMKQETEPVTDAVLAGDAIFNHLKRFFFILLGISVIGVPLILFLLFAKGTFLGLRLASSSTTGG